MTVRASDGWTKTVTPRVTARGALGCQPKIMTSRVQRELRKSAHYGYTDRC